MTARSWIRKLVARPATRPPRSGPALRRACWTRMSRMARAAAKKKCRRDSQATPLLSVRRRYASWTRAVGCRVCPGGSSAMRARASWCGCS